MHKEGGNERIYRGQKKNSLFLWNFPRHTPRQSYVFGPVDKWKAHGNPTSTHLASLREPPSVDQPNAFWIWRSLSRLYKGEFSFSLVNLKDILKIKNSLPQCLSEDNNYIRRWWNQCPFLKHSFRASHEAFPLGLGWEEKVEQNKPGQRRKLFRAFSADLMSQLATYAEDIRYMVCF